MQINKITQTTNGNIRFLDSSDVILYQVNRNQVVYLDLSDKAGIYISSVIDGHTTRPSETIRITAAQIGFIGGVAFSGTAQDLIDDLDSYFFG